MSAPSTQSNETKVEAWVLNNDGEIVELFKESKQVKEVKFTGTKTVEPRLKFSDLLYFMDVNTWHKRCILAKTALIGCLGWSLETEDEDKKTDKDHKTITEFLKNPNKEGENFTEICKRFLIDYLSTGSATAELVRNNKNEPSEIYHMPIRNVRRKKDFSGFVQKVGMNKPVEFVNFGDKKRGDSHECLFYYTYDALSDYYGAPDWLPAIGAMTLDRSMIEYNAYEFANGWMAKFIVIINGGELSTKARTNLKTFLQNNAVGVKNSGKTIVLSTDSMGAEINIERIDKEGSNKDLSFSKGRTLNRDEIVSGHGVPPRIVGILQSGQLGGSGEVEGQLTIFKQIDIDPQQSQFEEFINRTIISQFAEGNHKWKIKFNEMDITDKKSDAEFWNTLSQIGALTTDEIREELGRQPLEDDQITKIAKMAADLEATRLAIEKALEESFSQHSAN